MTRRLIHAAALALSVAVASVSGFACSSSGGSDSSESADTTCNSPVGGIRLQPAFANLQFVIPTTLVRTPDNSTWFVAEKGGTIKSFANNDNVQSADVLMDIRDRVNSGDREPGINGLAIHPQWPSVPEVYVTYDGFVDGTGYQWRMSRFVSKDGGKTLDPGSEKILFSANKPASEHNGGQMNFHPVEKGVTGVPLLYISIGDSEQAKGPLGNAQNTNTIFGKFLRIDILDAATRQQKNLEYDAPLDNPFQPQGEFPPTVTGTTTTPRGLKEIYSWGHRNPWRWNFDQHDGKVDIWEGEVGQDAFEEINIVKKAHNYGWNVKEALHRQQFCREFGNCQGAPLGVCDPSVDKCATDKPMTDPIIEVPHRADPNDPLTKNTSGYVASSVTGGFVYRGRNSGLSTLVGHFIYADFQNGQVYATVDNAKLPANIRAAGGALTPLRIGNGEMITSFQTDAAGEILALGFHGGIYRVVPGSCPRLPDPNARSYVFLSKQGILGFQEGLEYLVLANPDIPALGTFTINAAKVPKDVKDFGTFAEPSFTLGQWKSQFMAGETVNALYKNDLDLGFWRQMSCTKDISPGVGGCAVTNWPPTDDAGGDPRKGNALVPDPTQLTVDKTNLGTVTMNLSPTGQVRFYVFGGKAPHTIQPFAVLDGEGAKVAPALCTPCHGGTYAGSADVGSIFREFEPSALKRHPSVSQDAAEQQWFTLNQIIRATNQKIRGTATQPLANGVPTTQAIIDYIGSMYPTGAAPAIANDDPRHLPKSYTDNADGVTAEYKQSKTDLYTKLIGPYCSSCHRYNNTDLDKYDFVQNLSVSSGADVLLHQLIFPIASDPQRLTLPQMPQSAFQQFKLIQDGAAINAINAWVGQVHNPRVPECEVTFTIRTDIDQPQFDPNNEALRVLGQTTPPQGMGSLGGPDPLSNWRAADPGLDLSQTDSDPNGRFRFTGHASFPQGARIEFKGVVGKNESVRFELNGQGNRQLVVPSTTTTTVEFDWTN